MFFVGFFFFPISWVCLREEEIFAICFRKRDLKGSSKLIGVDLHFKPLNVTGNASLDVFDLINL